MIPRAVLDAVYAHARAAYPAECCGYLTGERDAAEVDAAVPCANAAGAPDRFAIDGAELLAFARSLDGPRPARVVYHSHPNGRAYFSPTDRAVAATDAGPIYPVQHLVVGVTAAGVTEAALFAWSPAARDFVEVARWAPDPVYDRPE
jgi:proteasome lid subunit RPN8/RPN11